MDIEHRSDCYECGCAMVVLSNGVSHHVDENDEIDHDMDANHVAYAEEDRICDDDGMSDAEADADVLRMAGWGTDEDYGLYNDWEENLYYDSLIERDDDF